MNVEQLRDLWRQKRGQEPPAAFSKDLIARALAYWLQEEVLGGLDLVKGERQSRSIIYRANLARFREVALFLLKDCCGGRQIYARP